MQKNNDETIEAFAQNLYENDLNDIESIRNPNDAYSIFLENFRTTYAKHFPLKKIKLKTKDLKSPWITAGNKKTRQNIITIKTFSNPSKDVQRNYIFKINTEIQK